MNAALQANLDNLNLYWQALGAEQEGELFVHPSWPNKRWSPGLSLHGVNFSSGQRASTVDELDDKCLQLLSAQHSLTLSVAMQLVVMTFELPQDAEFEFGQEIERVSTPKQVTDWTAACSNAFNYVIDEAVIQHLNADSNSHIFALYKEGEIAGTVILYKTGNTLGIHQLGTLREFRKMGVASALMQHSLALAKELGCEYVTLQASKAGLPLYEQLGFQQLAMLTSVLAE
ncbi:GNAT family N-acetyltransferase [Grimontia sp. S25]|uniref:GNAT family N-acetyltransferase n=1 Tax=Grimontia sedimenti TaxID=2711294 RepID=A0A6M1RCE1_9GAMM|nr:GNAT family N-acetyltransferase [Grimontia sedimenti]NGN97880.1 GNAT family N-acetyltransferase [Grimontia sedimenti]